MRDPATRAAGLRPPAPSNAVFRQLRARPRLFLALVVGLAVHGLLPASLIGRETTRLLLAWNAGTLLYLLLAAVMIVRATPRAMHSRAVREYEGRFVVLGGVILATLACLAAIFLELAAPEAAEHSQRVLQLGLVALTLVTSWAFIHLMFALHYAHDYYRDRATGGDGGLRFPDEGEPDYLDFVYFAAVIGTSGQTADVAFASRPMRRLGLVHCTLAYAFNTTLLALTINVASGRL